MDITVKPKRIAMIFLSAALIMVIGHIGGRISEHFYGRTFGFYFFDLNREDSIPTFVSSVGLGICSLLLFVVAGLVRRNRAPNFLYWVGLGILFLYMAIDEMVRIHEKLGGPLREVYDPEGLYDMVWLIPYGILVLLVGVVYLRFVLRLPRETKVLFIVSGLVYLTGVAGFEYLGGRQDALYGIGNFAYQAYVVLEEGLEMLGMGLFMYSILNHISIQYGPVRFIVPAKSAKNPIESQTMDASTTSTKP
ncbi:MAG: hypothetical protein P8Z42_03185 [Anaerolineales bacterium]|jgi:uncharacterized membrane protein